MLELSGGNRVLHCLANWRWALGVQRDLPGVEGKPCDILAAIELVQAAVEPLQSFKGLLVVELDTSNRSSHV